MNATNKIEIAAALEIAPRTKLSYQSVMRRAVRYARDNGLRDGLGALDAAAMGLSHYMDTGRASGSAYWRVRGMSAYKIVGLLCECANAMDYATVGNAADYYRGRFDG